MGLWLQLDAVAAPPDDNVFPDVPAQRPRRLVRWEFIHSAELLYSKEDMDGAVDFRPARAA